MDDYNSRISLVSSLSTFRTCVIFMSFRYNKLLAVISQSLSDIVKALKGLVVMSSELELMASSLFNNLVPDMWKSKARHTQIHTDIPAIPLLISLYVDE